jgi:hypothetical protein
MDLGLGRRALTVTHEVAAPPTAAWNVLTDLDAWPSWGPTVQRAELSEPGPLRLGSRGKVWTPVGLPLPFEITEFEAGRLWAWKVARIPATRHSVDPSATGCLVTFGVPFWAPAYLAVCAVGLKRIEALATAGVR